MGGDLYHLKLELGNNFLIRDEVRRLERVNRFDFKKTFGKNKSHLTKLRKKRRSLIENHQNGNDLDSCRLILLEIDQEIQSLESEIQAKRTKHSHAKSYLFEIEREYNRARGNFHEQLILVLKDQRKKQELKRAFYTSLGVAPEYHGNLHEEPRKDGTLHLFFGGKEGPLGLGHAHYIISPEGKLIYRRDPFEVRGRQNHIGPYNDGLVGGFDKPKHGYLNGEPCSLAYGWGTRKGYRLFAKGHLAPEQFRRYPHVIYGPGEGPINDGSLKIIDRRVKV